MPTNIEETLLSQMRQIAAENGLGDEDLSLADDVALADSGFDSLMVAILVTRLEDILGFDPFTDSAGASFPVTIGEFIRFYENAADNRIATAKAE